MLAHAINNVLSDSSRYETDVYCPLGTGSLFRTALRSETVRRCCALPYRNIASGSLKTLIVLLYSLPTILWLIAVCLFRKTDRIYVNSAVNFPGHGSLTLRGNAVCGIFMSSPMHIPITSPAG